MEEAYYTMEELLQLQESRLEKLGIPMAHRDKILKVVEELKKGVTFPKTFKLKIIYSFILNSF